MILLVHLLFGAVIGSIFQNPILAVILAFLGHYFLDLFPHIEYPIENITKKQWKKSLPDFVKVFLDILTGLTLIFIFSKNKPIIYVCAFFAILPDGISLLSSVFPNKTLIAHQKFHGEIIHWHKNNPPSLEASEGQRKISKF